MNLGQIVGLLAFAAILAGLLYAYLRKGVKIKNSGEENYAPPSF